MPMHAVDLTGQRFGSLQIICREGSTTGRTKCATWRCLCDCGREVVRVSQSLRKTNRPNGLNCGCRHGAWNTTHGMSGTRPHGIWVRMRQRCLEPSDKDWKNYGGRGVTVCAAWAESFDAFWADMRAGYDPRLTLGRKDNNGPYSPENCRWETSLEQGRNKRNTAYLDTPKGRMTLMAAAEAFGIPAGTLRARITTHRWPLDRALTTPVKKASRKFSTSPCAAPEAGSL